MTHDNPETPIGTWRRIRCELLLRGANVDLNFDLIIGYGQAPSKIFGGVGNWKTHRTNTW
jgi:hypothetical protein